MKHEQKSFVSEFKEIADDGRTVTGFAAVFGNVDSYGDRLKKGAFKKTIQENIKHVRHLWNHSFMSPPVAVIESLEEVSRGKLPDSIKDSFPTASGGLMVTRKYLDTDRGNEILEGIKAGAINEMSFGFNPIKYDFEDVDGMLVRNLKEVRLWDTSDVNWGANPATVASKAAVPFKDTGTNEGDWKKPTLEKFSDESWEDLSDAEKRRIANHYAWAADMPPDTFGDVKLPHHQAGKEGIGPAVWNGVTAAMGALLGARGGVKIAEKDRKSVYNHLAKHYEQFDKEPPDFKFIEAMNSTLMLSPEELQKGLSLYFGRPVSEIELLVSDLKRSLIEAEPFDGKKFADPTLTLLTLTELDNITKEIEFLKG